MRTDLLQALPLLQEQVQEQLLPLLREQELQVQEQTDFVSLGQVAPDLHVLSEDRLLWKKLCQYHFSERQVGMAQRSFLPGRRFLSSSSSCSNALSILDSRAARKDAKLEF